MQIDERKAGLIVKWREAKGWTQAELQAASGVPTYIITACENAGSAHAKNVRKLVDTRGDTREKILRVGGLG